MTSRALVTKSRATRSTAIAASALLMTVGLVLALALTSTALLSVTGGAGASLLLGAACSPGTGPRVLEPLRRRSRQRQRAARLARRDICTLELKEMTALIERTVYADPTKRDMFDVEVLLDRYVELSLHRDRLHRAVLAGPPRQLRARLAAACPERNRSANVLQRRLKLSIALEERHRAVAESIAALCELVRYCCERTPEPSLALGRDNDPVTSVLETVDVVEAAEQLVEDTMT